VSNTTVLGTALVWVALASLGFWWLWRQRRSGRSTGLKKALRVVVGLVGLLLVILAGAGFRWLWLEQRDRPVTSEDLRILTRADEILRDESVWNRQDDRECNDDNARGQWSLFCALEKACVEVLGQYDHRRVALQEVRFAVEDATRGRQFEHRLMDFKQSAGDAIWRRQTGAAGLDGAGRNAVAGLAALSAAQHRAGAVGAAER
jgi:hypothetical protein